MATRAIFVGSWRVEDTVLIASHSTTLALPIFTAGSSGSRVHAISLASTDAGANTALLYYAKKMTAVADMTTGAFVDGGGGSDTITRTAGSFITDGYKIGDRIVVAGATTLANSFFVTLTGVAALTLTFATAQVDTAEDFPSGAIIYRLCQLHLTTVAINAGNAASTDALDMLITDFPIADVSPDRYIILGPDDALAMSVGTAVGAAPDRIDIMVSGGDY